MTRDWLRRVERDAIALGSPIFYLLVLGRGLVGPFWDLVVPLTVIGTALLITQRWVRNADLYLTRGAVLAVLTTNHYNDAVFGAFAAAVFGFMIFAARDLGGTPRVVLNGVLLGACAALIAYGLTLPFD